MLAYKISTCEAYIIWRKLITACKIRCQLPSRGWLKLQWSHQDIKVDCFTDHGGTLSAFMGISICAVQCGMWNSHWRWSHWIYTKRRKWMRDTKFGKNNWFEIKNKTEDRGQSIPKSIGILTVPRCIFGQNSDFIQWWFIARTNSQTQNGVNSSDYFGMIELWNGHFSFWYSLFQFIGEYWCGESMFKCGVIVVNSSVEQGLTFIVIYQRHGIATDYKNPQNLDVIDRQEWGIKRLQARLRRVWNDFVTRNRSRASFYHN